MTAKTALQDVNPGSVDAEDMRRVVGFHVGEAAPANPSAYTRWISRSHRQLEVTAGKSTRIPILGGGALTLAAQEFSPWYNPILNRYEALVNIDSAQWFSYSSNPLGGWSTPVRVLGVPTAGGAPAGGEANRAQQCNVFVESGVLYAFYIDGAGGGRPIYMSTAPLPTNPNSPPVFTKQGQVWNEAGGAAGSTFIIKNPTAPGYYLFIERGQALKLASSSAASAADLIANPFITILDPLVLTVNLGARNNNQYGRPWVYYEASTATWIMYAHGGGLATISDMFKWTCKDVSVPTNWVADQEIPFIRRVHPFEVDQACDPRFVQGPNGNWFAYWSAADNRSFTFSIMASAMIEPTLAYDGVGNWFKVDAQSDPRASLGYFDPDRINAANADIKNGWEVGCDTANNNVRITFPPAAIRAYVKVTHAPSVRNANQLTVRPSTAVTGDVIIGPNPLTAMSASGATVTAVTKRRHGLSVGDLVTISGAAPALYNKTPATVASVVDEFTFTYAADASPGANTTIGYLETAIAAGECRRYRCWAAGFWTRD